MGFVLIPPRGVLLSHLLGILYIMCCVCVRKCVGVYVHVCVHRTTGMHHGAPPLSFFCAPNLLRLSVVIPNENFSPVLSSMYAARGSSRHNKDGLFSLHAPPSPVSEVRSLSSRLEGFFFFLLFFFRKHERRSLLRIRRLQLGFFLRA